MLRIFKKRNVRDWTELMFQLSLAIHLSNIYQNGGENGIGTSIILKKYIWGIFLLFTLLYLDKCI